MGFTARLVAAGMSCGLAILTSAVGVAQGGAHWTKVSDGSWNGRVVSLGQHGEQVFTHVGTFGGRAWAFSVHDQSPPTPLTEDASPSWTLHARVASAREGDVHVSLHHEYLSGSSGVMKAVLRKYSAVEGSFDWSYELPAQVNGSDRSDIAVSNDGSLIVSQAYDSQTSKTKLIVLGPESNLPLASYELNTLGPCKRLVLSADGTTALMANSLALTIVNVSTGALSWIVLNGQGNVDALALSEGEALVAFGTLGRLRIYEGSVGGGYELAHTHLLPQEAWCTAVTMSEDGSRLALGFQSSAELDLVHLRALRLDDFSITMQDSISSGAAVNGISSLQMSSSGDRFAAALWGDAGGSSPEIVVYASHSSSPLMVADLPGSPLAMELSGDGSRVAVASKSGHASSLGFGGRIDLLSVDAHDFFLSGVPKSGASVDLYLDGAGQQMGTALVALGLADEPLAFPGGSGSLFLERTLMWALPPVAAGADGTLHVTHEIPQDPGLIGQSLYYQGVLFAPRTFSGNYVQVTILP